jgi:hypothetical protein
MATARELQQAINRFANDPNIGFEPIACDGDPGKATLQAALWALDTIMNADPEGQDGPRATQASLITDRLNAFSKASEITALAPQLVALFTSSADAMGYAPIPCPSGVGAHALAVPRTPAAKASADRSRQINKALSAGILGLGLPDWVIYAGGAALALGIAMLIKNKKAATSTAVSVAGRR